MNLENFTNIINQCVADKVGVDENIFAKAYSETNKIQEGNKVIDEVLQHRLVIYVKNGEIFSIRIINESTYQVSCHVGFKQTPLNFHISSFEQYTNQLIDLILIPQIYNYYECGYLKTLPGKLTADPVDLSLINKDWFIDIFEKIFEEDYNGETANNITIDKNTDNTVILFELDCGRRGRYDNKIVINDKGHVTMDLADIIDGGAFEPAMKKAIVKLIKSKS